MTRIERVAEALYKWENGDEPFARLPETVKEIWYMRARQFVAAHDEALILE